MLDVEERSATSFRPLTFSATRRAPRGLARARRAGVDTTTKASSSTGECDQLKWVSHRRRRNRPRSPTSPGIIPGIAMRNALLRWRSGRLSLAAVCDLHRPVLAHPGLTEAQARSMRRGRACPVSAFTESDRARQNAKGRPHHVVTAGERRVPALIAGAHAARCHTGCSRSSAGSAKHIDR